MLTSALEELLEEPLKPAKLTSSSILRCLLLAAFNRQTIVNARYCQLRHER